jgi:hypothetical protein
LGQTFSPQIGKGCHDGDIRKRPVNHTEPILDFVGCRFLQEQFVRHRAGTVQAQGADICQERGRVHGKVR